jgi:hypothetical protein
VQRGSATVPKAKDTDIPVAYLRQCFEVDFEAGKLRWRTGRLIGKPAGSIHARSGYRRIKLNKRNLRAHRVVWTLAHGRWPDDEVDHRNGVKDDNRLENLREATHGQNEQNKPAQRNNTSGVPGVVWDKGVGKWKTQIKIAGRHINLGRYDDYDDACQVRTAAKQIVHPFQPTPRGVTMPEIKPYDRSTAAYRLIYAARRRGDHDLELDAWEVFLAN